MGLLKNTGNPKPSKQGSKNGSQTFGQPLPTSQQPTTNAFGAKPLNEYIGNEREQQVYKELRQPKSNPFSGLPVQDFKETVAQRQRSEISDMAGVTQRERANKSADEKAFLEAENQTSTGDKLKNAAENVWTNLKMAVPNLKVASTDIWEGVLGKEMAKSAFKNLNGEDIEKARLDAYNEINMLRSELKATSGSITDNIKYMNGAGLVVNLADALGSIVSTGVPAILTGGGATIPTMVGQSIVDYNTEKAKSKGVTVEELYKSGDAELKTPLLIGSMAGALELVGLKSVKNLASASIKGAGAKKMALYALELNKEGMTELLQGGLDAVNEAKAQGKSDEDAGKAFFDRVTSKEGLNEYLMGVFASGGVGAMSHVVGSIKDVATKKKVEANIAEIEQLEQDLVNENVSPAIKEVIAEQVKNKVADISTEIDNADQAVEKLSDADKVKTEQLNNAKAELETVVAEPNLSEAGKKVAEEQIKSIDEQLSEIKPVEAGKNNDVKILEDRISELEKSEKGLTMDEIFELDEAQSKLSKLKPVEEIKSETEIITPTEEVKQTETINPIADETKTTVPTGENVETAQAPVLEETAQVEPPKSYGYEDIDAMTNEKDVANTLYDEIIEPTELTPVEQAIRNAGGFTTNEASFNRFGDRNNINSQIAKSYLRKDGKSLDVIAQELSKDGLEVTPQDLIDYIEKYNDGNSTYSGRAKALQTKLQDMTGKKYNKFTVKKYIDKLNTEAKTKIESDPTFMDEQVTSTILDEGVTKENIETLKDKIEFIYGEETYNNIKNYLNETDNGKTDASGTEATRTSEESRGLEEQTTGETKASTESEKLTKAKEKLKSAKDEFSDFVKKSMGKATSGADIATFVAKATKLMAAYAEVGIVKLSDVLKEMRADYGDDFVNDNIDGITQAHEQANITETKAEPKKAQTDFDRLATQSLPKRETRETKSNVEAETGDILPKEMKEFEGVDFKQSLIHGENIVEAAKVEFGDSYVSDLLDYVENAKMAFETKAVILVSLENNLRKQLAENPKDARLRKQVNAVTKASIEHLRSGATAAAVGQFRWAARENYDAKLAAESIFSPKEREQRAKVEGAVASTPDEVQKQAEENEKSKAVDTDDLLVIVEKSKTTKEKKKIAIDEFNSAFDKALKALGSRTTTGVTVIPYAQQLANATPHILDMAKALGKISGISAQQIAEQIHKKISPYITGITEKDIKGIISAKKMSPELKRKLYIAQLNRQIADLDEQIANGERKEVSKEDKYKNDEEILALREERDERQKKLAEVDPAYAERRKLKSDLDSAQKSLDNWKKKIEDGNFEKASKEQKDADAKLADLRAERDKARDEYKKAEQAYEKSLITPEMIAEKEVADKIATTEKSIADLQEKLDNNDLSTTSKQSSIWTEEIGKLEAEKAKLAKELADKRKEARPKAEPKAPPTPQELLEQVKDRMRERIDVAKENIANKKTELNLISKKYSEDAEYKQLERELKELEKAERQFISDTQQGILDDRKIASLTKRLEAELADLDEQISKGERKAEEAKKDPLTNDAINELKARKKAKMRMLLEIDPDTTVTLKEALVEAGYGKEITVTVNQKDADGNDVLDADGKKVKVKEQRNVLDWKKLLGVEGSFENMRDALNKSLKAKGYSQGMIDALQQELQDEYNDIHKDIIAKSLSELNRRNTPKVAEQKILARRLAELYNLGLYDSDPDTYANILNNALGVNGMSQEAFNAIRDLNRSLAKLMESKDANGNRFSDLALAGVEVEVKNKIKKVVDKVMFAEGNMFYKASVVIKNVFSAMQRMMLASVSQLIENPISAKYNDVMVKLQDLTKKGKWDTKDLADARKMVSKAIYIDVVVGRGEEYGGVGNPFTTKNSIEDFVNSLPERFFKGKGALERVGNVITAALSGRAYLDASDSFFKLKRTELEFTHNLLRVLTSPTNPNKMSQEDALRYVSNALTGQSFKDAMVEAEKIIKAVNEEDGKDLIRDTESNIIRVANDLVKDNLVNGGAMTAKEVEASFKAGYTTAGKSIGHESNNLITDNINLMNSYTQRQLNEAIKNKEWSTAARLNLRGILLKNIISPFVGGGTNWVFIGLQKMGLPTERWRPDVGTTRRAIDLSTVEGNKELQRDLTAIATRQRMYGRIVVSNFVTLTALLGLMATGDEDDYIEWLRKHPDTRKLINKVIPTYIAMYLARDNKNGEFLKAIYEALGSRQNFDAIKVKKAAEDFYKASTEEDERASKKAWGAVGEVVGRKFTVPYLTTFSNYGKTTENLKRELVTGEKKPDYSSSRGFISGFYKGGLIDYLGMRPTDGDMTAAEQRMVDSLGKMSYKDEDGITKNYVLNDAQLAERQKVFNEYMKDEKADYIKELVAEYVDGGMKKDEAEKKANQKFVSEAMEASKQAMIEKYYDDEKMQLKLKEVKKDD